MIALKLAYRNLVGAGLRTWLNVIVLSFSFVAIIWHKGLIQGWNQQARRDTIDWEIGGGQYWHNEYDPYDPFTLIDSHAPIPNPLNVLKTEGKLTPILISQATIYPEGRIQSILLKGIDPDQTILQIPSAHLNKETEAVPAMIGTRMASNSRLKEGDFVTLRWRDTNGTFDATEIQIVSLFKTNVPTIDNGQMWIPLSAMQNMTQMPDEATLLVAQQDIKGAPSCSGWEFKDHKFLLAEFEAIIRSKEVGGSFFYILLLLLAMLAIFDTQVLSIFRRQREIGMHIAMGMTRGQVVRLFTLEGAMHSMLAAILAAVYGIPLLSIQAVHGFEMPAGSDDYGLAIAEKIFPVYSAGLIFGTVLLVMLTSTIVSFLPARKISKMKPTDAIKGKIT